MSYGILLGTQKMERKNVITVKVDDKMKGRLDDIIKESADLKLTKMDVVYVILWLFFRVNEPDKDRDKIRGLIIEMRKGIISGDY